MMEERAKMNLTISRKNKSQANVKDKIVAWEVKKKKQRIKVFLLKYEVTHEERLHEV